MDYILLFVIQLLVLLCAYFIGFNEGKRSTLKRLLSLVKMETDLMSLLLSKPKRVDKQRTTKVKSSKKK